MITTLRTAAAEIRRAIADSGAGAILAAWFGPVLADIAPVGAGRRRGVAGRLPRTAEARRDGVPAPVGRVAPVACPVRGRGDGCRPAAHLRPDPAVRGVLPEAGGMSRSICLVDLETTALSDGEVWEVGALEYGLPDDSLGAGGAPVAGQAGPSRR